MNSRKMKLNIAFGCATVVLALLAFAMTPNNLSLRADPVPPLPAPTTDIAAIQYLHDPETGESTVPPWTGAPAETPEHSYPFGGATELFSDVPDAEIDHEALATFMASHQDTLGEYRIVVPNANLLRHYIREFAQGTDRIEMILIGHAPVTIMIDEAEENHGPAPPHEPMVGSANLSGKLHGIDVNHSLVSFSAFPNGKVYGTVDATEGDPPRKIYIKLEPLKNTAHHVLWALDPDWVFPYASID